MRDEVKKRFEQLKRKIEREKLEADELAAKAETKQREAAEKQLRLDAVLPIPEPCPDCFVNGIISALEAAKSERAGFERIRCSRKCGFAFDVLEL